MLYRVANINDSEVLANLHAESWRESYRGIFPDQFLDNDVWVERRNSWANRLSSPKSNQYVLVAIDGDNICGFICAFGNESARWGTFIDNLHVSRTYQGKGIGKQLMHLIAKWADENYSHKGLYLEVLEDNSNARDFYHRMGAKHQETNLWLPPGSNVKVNDLLYIWENNLLLL
ncbi:GNAT family N-acetyltransferase [uncultured Shewanella sp.]|uniref:GNAT family N-acetyltransferase n=1 Tax=uncultured Shewanella sp. TaxID=173975 RepID=UPI00262BBBB9|nr:GNAT family N-acetyltransferase [uncultured Shewanella sp.]